MRKAVLVIPMAALGALAAGCGSSSTGGAPAGTTSDPSAPVVRSTQTATVTVPAGTTAAPATPATTAASGPAICATSALRVTLGDPDGAAGSVIYPLHFVNAGSATCTISGFPGVSYVAPGNGAQVGPAAQRGSAAGTTVTLARGAEATALVKAADYADFPASSCVAAATSGLRVYPPGNTASAYVPFAATQRTCSTALTLQVQPVAAGTG